MSALITLQIDCRIVSKRADKIVVNQILMSHYSTRQMQGHADAKGQEDLLTDKPSAGPKPVDVHVGGRIRLRRTLLGMSQERLGEALGLTFQQVQKYERGTNRVSASRLYELSDVLDVPVSFFFDGLERARRAPLEVSGFAQAQAVFGSAPEGGLASASEISLMSRRETVELVRTYYRIDDAATRRRVLDLIRMMIPPE